MGPEITSPIKKITKQKQNKQTTKSKSKPKAKHLVGDRKKAYKLAGILTLWGNSICKEPIVQKGVDCM